MRSLSPGREIPLRTSTKKAKEPEDSGLSTSALRYQVNNRQSERRQNNSLNHFNSLSRAVERIVRLRLQLSHQLDE
jgi:hypothetical protein